MSQPQMKPTKAKAGMVWQRGLEHQRSAVSADQKMQQSISRASNSKPISKMATKRRRQDEGSKTQGSSSSFLPSAKKGKLNDLSSAIATSEDSALSRNPSVSEGSILKPSDAGGACMATELPFDPSAYEVSDINIISSSQIQPKVSRILETLASFSFIAATKPRIVMVHAKASTASKCITVVEITKREIAKSGGKWYQYSRLEHATAVQDKTSPIFNGPGYRLGGKPGTIVDIRDTKETFEDRHIEEEETGFEIMKTPLERAIDGRPKVRAIPMLLIYLSRVRIESLKQAYGEQTNATT